ncbi:AraC family transcriptional regulator [Nocardia sp. 2YAB30]
MEPRARADFWSALMNSYHGRITYEYQHDSFRGLVVRQRSINYQLVGWKDGGVTYRRTDRDIRADPDQDYRLVLPATGGIVMSSREGRARVEPGSAVLATFDEPFELRPQPGTAGLIMTFPYRELDRRLGSIPPLITGIDFTTGLGRVIGDMARGLFEQRQTLTQVQFDAVSDRLVELLCMIVVGDDRPTALSHLSVVDASIRRYVRQHAADPTLDGRAIASALGWSLRQIQLALQQSGTTPRKLIKEERLNLAKERLSNPAYRGHTITHLAYQLGFSSVSAFSNAFREQFGHRPSDVPRP